MAKTKTVYHVYHENGMECGTGDGMTKAAADTMKNQLSSANPGVSYEIIPVTVPVEEK